MSQYSGRKRGSDDMLYCLAQTEAGTKESGVVVRVAREPFISEFLFSLIRIIPCAGNNRKHRMYQVLSIPTGRQTGGKKRR